MIRLLHGTPPALATVAALATAAASTAPTAKADNERFNNGVVANVYTIQHQAGCTNDVRISPQLQLAAEWHAKDLLNNRSLDGDTGSDGSTPQGRADTAGYHGSVAETVAINPAMAISGIELINQWYYNPADMAIMSDCANNQVGVWTENSIDRTVVVAVYGKPDHPLDTTGENVPLGSVPDYDASDELEFGNSWLPWILRGVYPPPAQPPQ